MVELTGNYEFAAPQALVWEMLQDADVLARVMPGCKKLARVGENGYEGEMNMRIGPVQGVFQGSVELSDVQPPDSFHLLVNGRGPSGVVRGEGDLQLCPAALGTEMRYQGTVQVSGRIASVGQRLMDSSAKAIVSQSLQNLEKQIQSRMQPEPEVGGETAAAVPPSPSQTEFILGVSKEMAADLVSNPRQRQLLGGLALLLALVGLLNWFANLVARRVVRMMQD